MFMDNQRGGKTLYFEAVAWGNRDNQLEKILKKTIMRIVLVLWQTADLSH